VTVPSVRIAAGPGDMVRVRSLFVEYAEAFDYDTCFDNFDQEMADLPGAYGPPNGVLLIANHEGEPVGAVGLKSINLKVAEIKRLYVQPRARGWGIGRRLIGRVLSEAASLGYERLVLETLPRMTDARALYANLGFTPIEGGVIDQITRLQLKIGRAKPIVGS
jgi:GNAT superfamily N-acetyltransferase